MTLLSELASAGFVLDRDQQAASIVADPRPRVGDRPGARHAPAALPGSSSCGRDGLGGWPAAGQSNPRVHAEERHGANSGGRPCPSVELERRLEFTRDAELEVCEAC